MTFTAPIGSVEEREAGNIWPGRWFDATGFLTHYSLGYHTGADLNLNYPHWDADADSEVYAIGDGEVTYAELFSPHAWGKIIVIDHGIVDGKPLFSRYAHVGEIEISVGESVSAGDPIATVGNAEGLFPYHLHFDISLTDRLRDEPNHWPGPFRGQVLAHYVDPKEWLRVKVSGDTVPTVQVYYVIATLGLRVRESHGTSATQVGLLSYGSRVSLEDAERVDEDA